MRGRLKPQLWRNGPVGWDECQQAYSKKERSTSQLAYFAVADYERGQRRRKIVRAFTEPEDDRQLSPKRNWLRYWTSHSAAKQLCPKLRTQMQEPAERLDKATRRPMNALDNLDALTFFANSHWARWLRVHAARSHWPIIHRRRT